MENGGFGKSDKMRKKIEKVNKPKHRKWIKEWYFFFTSERLQQDRIKSFSK